MNFNDKDPSSANNKTQDENNFAENNSKKEFEEVKNLTLDLYSDFSSWNKDRQENFLTSFRADLKEFPTNPRVKKYLTGIIDAFEKSLEIKDSE